MYPVDLHMHTVASTHAYSTLHDYIAEAKRKGIKLFAITDHGRIWPMPRITGTLSTCVSGRVWLTGWAFFAVLKPTSRILMARLTARADAELAGCDYRRFP